MKRALLITAWVIVVACIDFVAYRGGHLAVTLIGMVLLPVIIVISVLIANQEKP